MAMQAIFALIALYTLVMAIGAVTARNLFHAALFLIGSFLGVSIIYFLLEAEFLGVSQIIIYIGAIATLIVFAIMLSRSMMGREAGALNRYFPAVAIAAFLVFVALAWLVSTASFDVNPQAVPADAIAQIGRALVTEYVIPFEIASVMLLVALVGAIMIARERHP